MVASMYLQLLLFMYSIFCISHGIHYSLPINVYRVIYFTAGRRFRITESVQYSFFPALHRLPFITQLLQDDGFASLSGARVVRVATHPDATKLGYGSRAMELLGQFYEGKLVTFGDDEEGAISSSRSRSTGRASSGADETSGSSSGRASNLGGAASSSALGSEKLKPRKQLPPLLVNVCDIPIPERLHWLGVSYGLILNLFNFWKRSGYLPAYLRQTANDLTAEHTMIMLKPLDCADLLAHATPDTPAPRSGWHAAFVADFARRYMQLLSFEFRSFDPTLALSVMDAACSVLASNFNLAGGAAVRKISVDGAAAEEESSAVATSDASATEVGFLFTPHDLKRLESYSRNLVDYHMVLDLLPDLARLYFQGRVGGVSSLPRLQAAMLLCVGLQRTGIEAVAEHFNIAMNQALALFNKAVRKLSTALRTSQERATEAELDSGWAAGKLAATAAAARPASVNGASPAAAAAATAAPRGASSSLLSRSVVTHPVQGSSSSAAAARTPVASLKKGAAGGKSSAAAPPSSMSSAAAAAAAAAVDDEEEEDEEVGGLPPAATAVLLADAELKRYALPSDEGAWAEALASVGARQSVPSTLSVRKASAAADASSGSSSAKSAKKRSGGEEGSSAAVGGDGEMYDPRNRLEGKHRNKKAKSAR